MSDSSAAQIPLVEYLELGDSPHLVANECTSCGARYFDRRNGCAKCGTIELAPAVVANEGRVTAFTVVRRAMPGVPVPYVSSIVETDDGTTVRANLVGIDPEAVDFATLGTRVRLTTFPVGTDDEGTEAVAFGYTPA